MNEVTVKIAKGRRKGLEVCWRNIKTRESKKTGKV